ncbi:DUF4113 domain-containing protein [Terripilifer ovatus]
MQCVDRLNARYGRGAISLAAIGARQPRRLRSAQVLPAIRRCDRAF